MPSLGLLTISWIFPRSKPAKCLLKALILIFTYKYSFQLSYILNLVDTEKTHNANEFKIYRDKTNSLLVKSGLIGFLLLLSSVYILIGIIRYAGNSDIWGVDNSIGNLIFSTQTFTSFLFYASLSIMITSISVLYIFFKPGSEYAENKSIESEYIRNFILKTAMIFLLVLPVLFLIYIFFNYIHEFLSSQ